VFKLNVQRVLVVEDIAPVRRALKRIVERIGPTLEVQTANDGTMASQMILKANDSGAPFDLCIADIHLPHVSGLELAQSLRDVTDLATPFFVLMTGRPTPEILSEVERMGVPLLPKPFTLEDLESAMAAISQTT